MERRNADSITEADIGKVFLMFEEPTDVNPTRSNRMFTVVSVKPQRVRFADFNVTLSEPVVLPELYLEREIIELNISSELMLIMRGFTPGGLTFLEQQAALRREKEYKPRKRGDIRKKTIKRKGKSKKV
jgi:hypothetical protein